MGPEYPRIWRAEGPRALAVPRRGGRQRGGLEPGPQLPRRDRERLDLEEEHPFGPLEPLQHRLEPLARVAGPRRDAQPRPAPHLVRLLPAEGIAELVGADQEDQIGRASWRGRV